MTSKTTESVSYVSTGRLPAADTVAALVAEAHARFHSNREGMNSDVYPALAAAPSDLFGLCVAGTNGAVYAAGDSDVPFTIMSVSKPFVFALVCGAIGMEEARRKLGVNGTGLPFNSIEAVERSSDGRTNPMVNPGAIASTTSAKTKGFETLWIENDVSTSPISKYRPRAPTTEIPNQSGDASASAGM